MRKQLIIGLVILGVSALILSGCNKSHMALNGVYYGYYVNNIDNNQFVILAFDPNHPDKVAIRENSDFRKLNNVFPVKYTKTALTIYSGAGPIQMQISNDSHTLTCTSCDGITKPITYTIDTYNGKVVTKVGGIAFNTISKDAKVNGGISYNNQF